MLKYYNRQCNIKVNINSINIKERYINRIKKIIHLSVNEQMPKCL